MNPYSAPSIDSNTIHPARAIVVTIWIVLCLSVILLIEGLISSSIKFIGFFMRENPILNPLMEIEETLALIPLPFWRLVPLISIAVYFFLSLQFLQSHTVIKKPWSRWLSLLSALPLVSIFSTYFLAQNVYRSFMDYHATGVSIKESLDTAPSDRIRTIWLTLIVFQLGGPIIGLFRLYGLSQLCATLANVVAPICFGLLIHQLGKAQRVFTTQGAS